MTNPVREPVSTFNKRPFFSNHFELCNLMRVGRKQHILSTTLRRHKSRFLKFSFLAISLQNQKDVNAKSFGYVTGLKNSSFNAIKVFKTNVTRSQRNGIDDDTKIKYCRWVAGRRLTNGSIVNNFKLEEEIFT